MARRQLPAVCRKRRGEEAGEDEGCYLKIIFANTVFCLLLSVVVQRCHFVSICPRSQMSLSFWGCTTIMNWKRDWTWLQAPPVILSPPFPSTRLCNYLRGTSLVEKLGRPVLTSHTSPRETEPCQSWGTPVSQPCSERIIPPTNWLGCDYGAEELCPGNHGLAAATPDICSPWRGLRPVLPLHF